MSKIDGGGLVYPLTKDQIKQSKYGGMATESKLIHQGITRRDQCALSDAMIAEGRKGE